MDMKSQLWGADSDVAADYLEDIGLTGGTNDLTKAANGNPLLSSNPALLVREQLTSPSDPSVVIR